MNNILLPNYMIVFGKFYLNLKLIFSINPPFPELLHPTL